MLFVLLLLLSVIQVDSYDSPQKQKCVKQLRGKVTTFMSETQLSTVCIRFYLKKQIYLFSHDFDTNNTFITYDTILVVSKFVSIICIYNILYLFFYAVNTKKYS